MSRRPSDRRSSLDASISFARELDGGTAGQLSVGTFRPGRRSRVGRAVVRMLLVLAGVMTVVVAGSAPAGAHSLSGAQATNFETIITKLTPRISGVKFRVIDLGSRIELRNDSHHVVEVLGYDHEPYLRVGNDSVERNTRSPATFLNRTQLLPGPVPDSYDATAPPKWEKIASSGVARWHDHRTHWMATSAPPVVTRDPGDRHVVIPHWSVPLLVDGRPATLSGTVVWVPGPSPVPWVILALLIAGLVLGATLTRFGELTIKGALGIGAVAALVLAAGEWRYSTSSFVGHIGVAIYEVAAAVLAAAALVRLQRSRSLYAAGPLILLAGIVIAIGAGLANITDLFRSQLPTVISFSVARLLVTASLGLGVGLATVGARNLARSDRRSTRRPLARPAVAAER